MPIQIAYYYRKSVLDAARHDSIRNLLSRLQGAGRITAVVADADAAFSNEQSKAELFGRLRDFAMCRKAGLSRIFGSRRQGFWYLPPQFVLVWEGETLREVFPCQIGDSQVEPLEYLESVERSEPWTVRSGAGMEGKKHKALVAQILAQPDLLEPGLTCHGQNVQVSQDFGELGYIDLMFGDREDRTLLVEVKVRPDELDKAIGQIQRHCYLFAKQNRVEESSIRIGIACPFIPDSCRAICARAGISCFEILQAVTAKL